MLRFVFMSAFMYVFQVLDVFGILKKNFPKYLQDEPYQVPCKGPLTFPFWKTSSKTAWSKHQKNRRDVSISHRSTNSGFVA